MWIRQQPIDKAWPLLWSPLMHAAAPNGTCRDTMHQLPLIAYAALCASPQNTNSKQQYGVQHQTLPQRWQPQCPCEGKRPTVWHAHTMLLVRWHHRTLPSNAGYWQWTTIQYSTVQYTTVLLLYCTVRYSTVLAGSGTAQHLRHAAQRPPSKHDTTRLGHLGCLFG